MDVPEPEQTPYMAVTAQTSKLARVSESISITIQIEDGKDAILVLYMREGMRGVQ